MGRAILEIADDMKCSPNKKTKKTLTDFFQNIKDDIKTQGSETGITVGGELSLPLLSKFFIQVERKAQSSKEVQQKCRESIRVSYSDWKEAMNSLAWEIARKSNGKLPVLIFEDLDKLLRTEVWCVFYEDAPKLAGFDFPVIYTFRSAFLYDPKFNSANLSRYYKLKLFPMIHLVKQDGSRNEEGYLVIHEIIRRRANLSLFDTDPTPDRNTLDYMIEKTGGSLRELFDIIRDSFHRARRRRSTRIEREDAKEYIKDFQEKLVKQIDSQDYSFLDDIYQGNNQSIQNRDKLIFFLENGVLLEHSGWYSVHPLVIDFLRSRVN